MDELFDIKAALGVVQSFCGKFKIVADRSRKVFIVQHKGRISELDFDALAKIVEDLFTPDPEAPTAPSGGDLSTGHVSSRAPP